MKFRSLIAALAVLMGACVPPRPPSVPTAPVTLTTHVVVPSGEPVVGAVVSTIDGVPPEAFGQSTNDQGVLVMTLPVQDFTVCVDRLAPAERQCQGVRLRQDTEVTFTLSAAPPPVPPTPPATVVERATGEDLLHVLADFGTMEDSKGQIIYTPAIAGADPDTLREWLDIQRAAGTTHIVFGPMHGGPAYPGVNWSNPDWTRDPAGLRAFVELLLATPSGDGKGFRPVMFLGPDDHPAPYIASNWGRLAQALDGLQDYVIYLPGWEPVVGGWTTREVLNALLEGHRLFGPNSNWFVHLSPGRGSWSSNPVEDDDPFKEWVPDRTVTVNGAPVFVPAHWESCEICSWSDPRVSFVKGFFFQTFHGRSVTEPCGRSIAARDEHGDGFKYPEECYKDRLEDSLVRIGAGLRTDDLGHILGPGWTKKKFVVFETNIYERFHHESSHQRSREIASEAFALCNLYQVKCGFGSGLPFELHP